MPVRIRGQNKSTVTAIMDIYAHEAFLVKRPLQIRVKIHIVPSQIGEPLASQQKIGKLINLTGRIQAVE